MRKGGDVVKSKLKNEDFCLCDKANNSKEITTGEPPRTTNTKKPPQSKTKPTKKKRSAMQKGEISHWKKRISPSRLLISSKDWGEGLFTDFG